MTRHRVKVFFDGGCRPNPGPIEAAVVVRGTAHLFGDLGTGGNGDAEWLALIRAMETAQALGLADVEFVGDALEVVRQANRALAAGPADPAIPAGARHHAAQVSALAETMPTVRIRWIRRAQNLAGIALSRRHPR